MVRNCRTAKQSLLKKGFIEVQKTKHIHYVFWYKGKRICETRMSRNNQDLNDYLLSAMKDQLFLDKTDFIDLIDCPLSEENYIKILAAKNLLKE